MTVGNIIKSLVMAENYNEARMKVSDEFVNMAKVMLGDYEYIREKEEKYQELLKMLEDIKL
jgi:hypothetical protein